MNEKSLVGKTFKMKNGKEIKVVGHDQLGVHFIYHSIKNGSKGKGHMDWNQFKKEFYDDSKDAYQGMKNGPAHPAGHAYESKASKVLKLLEYEPVLNKVPQPKDEYEMKFKHHDKDAVAHFYVWDKGSPNKTTYQSYDPGDAPELELVGAYFDDGEEITDLTPEEKEQLTIQAAERYAELDHDTSGDDEYDRANDR